MNKYLYFALVEGKLPRKTEVLGKTNASVTLSNANPTESILEFKAYPRPTFTKSILDVYCGILWLL